MRLLPVLSYTFHIHTMIRYIYTPSVGIPARNAGNGIAKKDEGGLSLWIRRRRTLYLQRKDAAGGAPISGLSFSCLHLSRLHSLTSGMWPPVCYELSNHLYASHTFSCHTLNMTPRSWFALCLCAVPPTTVGSSHIPILHITHCLDCALPSGLRLPPFLTFYDMLRAPAWQNTTFLPLPSFRLSHWRKPAFERAHAYRFSWI